jgi:hypothetical protein
MQPPLIIPDWLAPAPGKPGVFNCDADKFYPTILATLAAPSTEFDGKVDQYWLEVAFQFMKLEAQMILRLNGLDPRPAQSLVLNVIGSDHKEKWAQKLHPVGRLSRSKQPTPTELEAGRKRAGLDAKEYFRQIYGFMPN